MQCLVNLVPKYQPKLLSIYHKVNKCRHVAHLACSWSTPLVVIRFRVQIRLDTLNSFVQLNLAPLVKGVNNQPTGHLLTLSQVTRYSTTKTIDLSTLYFSHFSFLIAQGFKITLLTFFKRYNYLHHDNSWVVYACDGTCTPSKMLLFDYNQMLVNARLVGIVVKDWRK